MRRIIFDDKAVGWGLEDALNRLYIKDRIAHLENMCCWRGYLYLNEVYETLGISWNPDDENVCFKYPIRDRIWFEPIGNLRYEIFIK